MAFPEAPPIVGYSYYNFWKNQSGARAKSRIILRTFKRYIEFLIHGTGNDADQDDGPEALLSYGLAVFGDISSVFGIPALNHFSQFKIGFQVTKRFSIVCQIIAVIFFLFALVVIPINVRMIFPNGINGLTDNESNLAILTVTTCEILKNLFINGMVIWAVRQRKFLYNFIFGHCRNITAPKGFQRSTMVTLFILNLLNFFFSEPTLSIMDMIWTVRPEMIKLIPSLYYIVKYSMISSILLIILWLHWLLFYIPTIICFVSNMMANYLDRKLNRNIHYLSGLMSRVPIGYREAQDPTYCQLVERYALNSVTDDWPSICDSNLDVKLSRDSQRLHQTDIELPFDHHRDRFSTLRCNDYCYKQASRILSELRCSILELESKFSPVSVMVISLQVFTLSHAIVVSFMQARSSYLKGQYIFAYRPMNQGLSIFRICLLVGNFIIFYTLFSFLHDNLPSRLKELRCKLFSLTIDQFILISRFSSKNFDDEMEMRLAWTLYDHTNRLSHECTLKLLGHTEIKASSEISILSEVLAFLLLYVQIFDVAAS